MKFPFANGRTIFILQGLESTIDQLLPCVKHRHYGRHVVVFTSHALKDRLWSMARASCMGKKFKREMEQLEVDDPAAGEWFNDNNPRHWSRSHFSKGSKCDILLNNLCESLNAAIIQARDKPILTMLERIRH